MKLMGLELCSIEELIELGKNNIEELVCYIKGLEATIGVGNEIHPDYMDVINEAI